MVRSAFSVKNVLESISLWNVGSLQVSHPERWGHYALLLDFLSRPDCLPLIE